MKQILITTLLLCGVFFASPGYAQTAPEYTCPNGGTYYEGLGCGIPKPATSCRIAGASPWPAVHPVNQTSVSYPFPTGSMITTCPANTNVTFYSDCENSVVYDYTLPQDCSTSPFTVSMTRTVKQTSQYVPGWPKEPHAPVTYNDAFTNTKEAVATWITSTEVECPDDFPLEGVYQEINYICYYVPEPPQPDPCDCNDFRGEAPYSFENLIAPVGTYNTTDNMPQCMTLSRSADPTNPDAPVAQCECQVSAKKWLKFSGPTIDGVEHDRWEAYPVAQGQPSGTITGVTCAKDDAVTEPTDPDAPKDCFTLKSGVKWCWADPGEKCTIVNGQEQCSSGCGYINGDFVCYDTEEPTTPDRPDTDLTDPDDTITDPNKTMPDITKGDLKEINRGTETRLDNVVTSLQNNNNQLKNIGDGIAETNDNLDGIGRQLDGQGKTLTGIQDGIEDAFGDDGEPDGAGDGETNSWYESAYPDGLIGIWNENSTALQETPMFDFLNQFQLAPSGEQPDLTMCFNFGPFGDYGCKALEIPSIIWAFLKICILITAAWLCRALIFGG